jgi:hypothetical protein
MFRRFGSTITSHKRSSLKAYMGYVGSVQIMVNTISDVLVFRSRVKIVLPVPGQSTGRKRNSQFLVTFSRVLRIVKVGPGCQKRRAPGDTRKAERGKRKKVVVLQIGQRIVNHGRTARTKKLGSGTMKTLMAVAMGLMLVAAMTFASGSLAVAGPGGPGGPGGGPSKHHPGSHHGKHHGGHGGYGPGYIVDASSVVVGGECYTVKRCRINEFGEERCRLVEECD